MLEQALWQSKCDASTDGAALEQLQGLQEALSQGHSEGQLSFDELGRVHIGEAQAMLHEHAKKRIGHGKFHRICEAFTRFHLGERCNQGGKADEGLTASLVKGAETRSCFTCLLHISDKPNLAWSAMRETGCWVLKDLTPSPCLGDLDVGEVVHLLYSYAALFQAEMEARGLKLQLQGPFERGMNYTETVLEVVLRPL